MNRAAGRSRRAVWVFVSAVFAGAFALLPASAGAQVLTFTHLAGSGGGPGWFDGTGSGARFGEPSGVAVDASGNAYVASFFDHTVRKVSPGGAVTTLAGLAGSRGSADGTGNVARFASPAGVAVDGAGNVYVADAGNHTIRKVTAAGVVTTLAGLAGSQGSADGTGSAARFASPAGVAVDGAGNVVVADYWNDTIRKVTPEGAVTTLAGVAGSRGSEDGTGSAARFNYPSGVAVERSGNVLVVDKNNHTIRKVTAAGVVTTLAGLAGSEGSADGTGSAARFNYPHGVAVDGAGNAYVTDYYNDTIRKVTAAGVVTTLAGLAGSQGSADGTGSAARFYEPSGIAADSSGNVTVADNWNHTVRKVTPGGEVTTLAGLAAAGGSADGTGSAARFRYPWGVAVDGAGSAYVADHDNHAIRKVSALGVVTTLAGLAGSEGSEDGTGSAARFNFPGSVAVDSSGNAYVADCWNQTIRKVTPGGVVTTLAGLAGSEGSADGTGSAARFRFPSGVAVDGSGNVFVADSENQTIRKVSASGVVTTLAGRAGSEGSADGTGSAARFNEPGGVAVDGSGNVYVADTDNFTIRKVSASGVVTTLAGRAESEGSADGTGSAARFYYPSGVAVDGSGNLIVVDSWNHSIRKVSASGVVTTLAGLAGSEGSADGTGSGARFYYPSGVAVDGAGNVTVADQGNNAIRRGRLALPDAATVDSPSGPTGSPVSLSPSPSTATSWRWDVVRRPVDSAAPLNPSAFVQGPKLRPEKPGLYTFRLTASESAAAGGRQSITLVDYTATGDPVDPAELPLQGGKVWVEVSWKNQYSGASGTGRAIPKGEQYGFLYFADSSNPELFVKVLDFGAASPYLLFWGGLTDFEYTVKFTNASTGASVSFFKAAYGTAGGADTQSLPHVRAVLWDAMANTTRDLPPDASIAEAVASGARGLPRGASIAGWGAEEVRPEMHRFGVGSGRAVEYAKGIPGPAAAGEILLSGGNVAVSVTWRSQYSGETGQAVPIAQKDEFCFFYFSDAGNPEVFVKVLDWGAPEPFKLFAAGLTNFEYAVSFRVVATGSTAVFRKTAGTYDGYAANLNR